MNTLNATRNAEAQDAALPEGAAFDAINPRMDSIKRGTSTQRVRQTREAWACANLGTLKAAGLTIEFPTDPDCITIGFRSDFQLPMAADMRADLLRWMDAIAGRLQSVRETVESLEV